ncbi:MAG: adenine phosphoribosyltransferase [Gammaproteobacteria bacterium]|nr:MAG: adenine phosphoribosyltransferase [Gammaproteobacteria bacterium]
MEKLKAYIRDIPDFPKKGIIYKDITPLLAHAESLQLAVTELAKPFLNLNITAVAGMEARGFIFGSLVAAELNVGFIPFRKPGKLPADVESVSYSLEYGEATLEVHRDAIKQGDKILLVDDLLATGGTAKASCQLVEKLGGDIVGCAFVIELSFLDGKKQLADTFVHSLIQYS